MVSPTKKKKMNENQEAVCSGLTSVAGFCIIQRLEAEPRFKLVGRTNLGIERDILSWDERWDDESSKRKNSKLDPHEPTLTEVERFKGEGTQGIDVPVHINDPGTMQNPDEVSVCHVRDPWRC